MCARCHLQTTVGTAEPCWVCRRALCRECFLSPGECGHSEQELIEHALRVASQLARNRMRDAVLKFHEPSNVRFVLVETSATR